MRRYTMLCVGGMLLVAGCGTFSAHSNVIEEVDGRQFTAQQLADFLTAIRAPIQINTQVGMLVTRLWTDATLFSQAVATNTLTTDSTLVAQALWPAIASARVARLMDTVVAQKAKISDATLDSAYNADQLRPVQHILIQVDSNAPKAQRDAARKKADSLLKLIHGGTSFSKLAAENTDDPGSRADSGFYPPKTRSTWVKPFGDALWALKPGEVSPVVPTQFGFHIIRRPTRDEALKLWRDTLVAGVAAQVQNAYMDQLLAQYDVKVASNVVPHMRAAIGDLDAHRNDHTTLTTYKGGSFTAGDFVHWISALTSDPVQGPQMLESLRQQPDSQFRSIAKEFTKYTLLLKEADKQHINLAPAEWNAMRTGFIGAVDSLKTSLGLVPPTYNASASEHERTVEAANAVDQYFKDIVNQKTTPKGLPGVLAATLREHAKVHFNAVALQQGLDLARSKHAADSAKGAASQPGALQPAPGGPPVTGGDTGARSAPAPAPKPPAPKTNGK